MFFSWLNICKAMFKEGFTYMHRCCTSMSCLSLWPSAVCSSSTCSSSR